MIFIQINYIYYAFSYHRVKKYDKCHKERLCEGLSSRNTVSMMGIIERKIIRRFIYSRKTNVFYRKED